MEVEKMEIDAKPATVKVEIDEASEKKMDTVIKVEVKEDSHDWNNKPEIVEETKGIKKEDETIIDIIPKEAGLAYLKVNGMVVDDENVTMTAEEVREYIEKAVLHRINKNNPLSESNTYAKSVQAEIKGRRNLYQELARVIDMIESGQLKFLRTDKTLRRYLTKTGGVGVDLPVLPNAFNAAADLKKAFPSQATNFSKPISAPASTRTTSSAHTTTSAASHKLVTPKANSSTLKESLNNVQKPAPKPAADIECIDLTDESETSSANNQNAKGQIAYMPLVKHPAPLPPKPFAASDKSWLPPPPKPRLKISAEERGIVLQWDMIPNNSSVASYAKLSSFDIFGYHEQNNVPINTLLWKKIGTVNAMTLPMACTLTQFIEGNTYHFSIRAVDVHNRCGGYSDPISIVYKQSKS